MKEELMDNTPKMHPYALSTGEGWTYHAGIDFTIKAGELGPGRRLAVMEYITRRGEEPDDHTHPTEDEIFYVLQGTLTFRCGEETFELDSGGFIFLPRGIQHGYTIRSEGDVRLLVMTTPAQEEAIGGWGGFAADIEAAGELRTTPPWTE
jgi:quercetin dioxygenase-like cupin family protein